MRRIEREQTRIEFFEGTTAAWTTHLSAHDSQTIFRVEQACGAATDLQCALREITRVQNPLGIDHTDDDVDRVFFKTLELSKLRNGNRPSVDIKRIETLALSPVRNIGMETFARLDEWREHPERSAFRC